MAQMNKEKFLAWVTKNVGKVVLGVQALLLAAAVVFLWQESNAPDIAVPDVQPKDPTPQLDPKDPKTPAHSSYQKVMAMVVPRPEIEASEYVSIIQINTFDPKTVKNSDQLTKEADKGLAEAKTLFEQGNLDEAEARIKKVLEGLPGHKGSLELKKKIADARKPSAAPAAGAKGTPPAAPTPKK